jgi:hypothetical protein
MEIGKFLANMPVYEETCSINDITKDTHIHWIDGLTSLVVKGKGKVIPVLN